MGTVFLTEQDLAERWQCTPGWLANERCSARGPRYHKLNRLVRYKIGDVEEFEAMHVVRAGSEAMRRRSGNGIGPDSGRTA